MEIIPNVHRVPGLRGANVYLLIDPVLTLVDAGMPGQTETIDAIIRDYPHLTDDDFVTENLHTWLSS